MSEPVKSIRRQVREYLDRVPGSTAPQVAKAIGMESRLVSQSLHQMYLITGEVDRTGTMRKYAYSVAAVAKTRMTPEEANTYRLRANKSRRKCDAIRRDVSQADRKKLKELADATRAHNRAVARERRNEKARAVSDEKRQARLFAAAAVRERRAAAKRQKENAALAERAEKKAAKELKAKQAAKQAAKKAAKQADKPMPVAKAVVVETIEQWQARTGKRPERLQSCAVAKKNRLKGHYALNAASWASREANQ